MSIRSTILSLTRKVEATTPAITKNSCQFSTSAVAKQLTASRNNKLPLDRELSEKSTTLETIPESLQKRVKEPMAKETSFSLEPYIGRSVTHTNAQVAYRQLNGILSRNKIRQDVRNNRHFVKPNEARRQQKLESQRKIFNAMVKKKIGIIMQMKQRGM